MRHRAHSASTRLGANHAMTSELRLNMSSHPPVWILHNDWSNFDATDAHRHRKGDLGRHGDKNLRAFASDTRRDWSVPVPASLPCRGSGQAGLEKRDTATAWSCQKQAGYLL